MRPPALGRLFSVSRGSSGAGPLVPADSHEPFSHSSLYPFPGAAVTVTTDGDSHGREVCRSLEPGGPEPRVSRGLLPLFSSFCAADDPWCPGLRPRLCLHTASLCVWPPLLIRAAATLDQEPVLLQGDLILTNHVGINPVSECDRAHRYWEGRSPTQNT